MSKILTVGVVGAGYAGKVHLKMLKRIKNVKIKTLCDTNKELVTRTAMDDKIPKYYYDFNEMLNNEELDFITLCTPPSTHAPLTKKAIELGVHVLIEKPMTATTQEAMEILNALKRDKNNIKVGVVHSRIFNRVIKKTRTIFQRGEIGHLLNIIIAEMSPFSFDPFISNQDHWCHKLKGGRVCESLPHQIYLAQEFMSQPKINNISAKKLGSAPWVSFDELRISLESKSSLGSIYWSRNTQKAEYLIYLIGSKGTLRANLMSGVIVKLLHISPETAFTDIGRACANIRYGLGEIRQTFTSLVDNYGRKIISRFGVGQAYPFEHEICFRSFIDSIINEKEPYVDAQKGYDCIRLVEKVSRELTQAQMD
jgi:predicted dehydrogenase